MLLSVQKSDKSTMRRRGGQKGISLLEVMITVAIVSILIGIAAPSFRTYIMNQRAQAIGYRLMADLRMARSEAIEQNTSCSVKRIGESWSSGWQIIDCGTDCAADGTGCPAARSVDSSRWTLSEANDRETIIFRSSGRVDPSTNATFTLCPSQADSGLAQRRLVISGASITLNRVETLCD